MKRVFPKKIVLEPVADVHDDVLQRNYTIIVIAIDSVCFRMNSLRLKIALEILILKNGFVDRIQDGRGRVIVEK